MHIVLTLLVSLVGKVIEIAGIRSSGLYAYHVATHVLPNQLGEILHATHHIVVNHKSACRSTGVNTIGQWFREVGDEHLVVIVWYNLLRSIGCIVVVVVAGTS